MRVDVEDPDDPDMEVPFDPDDTPSHVGRLVKVRHSASEPWSHAVVCFAFTDWHLEDYYGDGVMRRVERPNGGYQLQWGMFERVELARKQKRKRSKFSSDTIPYKFDELIAKGLLEFTDKEDDPGTFDLEKCSDPLPKKFRESVERDARLRAEAAAKAAAAKKAAAAARPPVVVPKKPRSGGGGGGGGGAARRPPAAAASKASSRAAAAKSATTKKKTAAAPAAPPTYSVEEELLQSATASGWDDDDENLPRKKRGRPRLEDAAAAILLAASRGDLGLPKRRKHKTTSLQRVSLLEEGNDGGGGGGGARSTPAEAATAASPGERERRATATAEAMLGKERTDQLKKAAASIAKRIKEGEWGTDKEKEKEKTADGGARGTGNGVAQQQQRAIAPPPPSAPAPSSRAAAPPTNEEEEESEPAHRRRISGGGGSSEETETTAVGHGHASVGARSTPSNPPTAAASFAEPPISDVFVGGRPTSWILRLLASHMTRDTLTRQRFAVCLAALEEKNYDFAERVVHDLSEGAKDAWSYRILEYCYKMTGRSEAASLMGKHAEEQEEDDRVSAAGGPGAASHGRVSGHGDSTGQILGGGSGGTAQSGAYGHARPLPTKAIGASSDASGAVGLVFQLVMAMAGDAGNWTAARQTAARHAARYPTESLLLMVHGGILWRQGHLKAAVAPLTDAMAHDENECRAAPWLFEVFLRLDMKEEAQWVWDKCCEVNQGLTVSLKNIAASVTRAQKLHAQRRR